MGWPKAHALLIPDGWMALIGHVVVRRPGEPEVYAATADLHEQFAPGHPDWGDPPLEAEVRAATSTWGPGVDDPDAGFDSTTVRWYPTVQWFDGTGFADHLRSLSSYRRLARTTRTIAALDAPYGTLPTVRSLVIATTHPPAGGS